MLDNLLTISEYILLTAAMYLRDGCHGRVHGNRPGCGGITHVEWTPIQILQ